ncbi:MAG: DUF3267 domain-containing protein [Clostridiales bacterium]|nr:DUF3267 domain-containing protein [Clostridiales bacterium]
MKNVYDYKAINRLDLSDPKFKMLNKLNIFAFITILVSCVVGISLNYFLRMAGQPGGMYFIYILIGVVLCLIYPYFHEFAHAFAIVISRGKKPCIKFGKFAAYCGSPDIIFTKAQYFFAASFPFVFFCAVLIPLCVYLPAEYFVLPFMPLMYNVFGSVADYFMIYVVLSSPKRGIVVDCGTDIVIYVPGNCEAN